MVTRKKRHPDRINAIAIDTETTGPSLYHGCEAFMVTACDIDGDLYCWEGLINPYNRKVSWSDNDIKEMIEVFSQYAHIVFHNATFDLRAIELIDQELYNVIIDKIVDDTIIQSHIVNSAGSHKLKDLAIYYLDLLDDDEAELKLAVQQARTLANKVYPDWVIAGQNIESLPNYTGSYSFCDYWLPAAIARHLKYPENHPWYTVCQKYGERDVERTISLYCSFIKYLRQAYQDGIYEDHCEVIHVVKAIQDGGFHFFKDKAEAAIEQLTSEITPYTELIAHLVGPDFNINSPKQLCELLYDHYGLPILKVTDKGSASTDAETLNELAVDFCDGSSSYEEAGLFLNALLEVRVRNTTCNYINNYLKYAKPYNVWYSDGSQYCLYYLHPSLNQTGTATTRFSCSNPNSQNISKGKEEEDDQGNKRRVFNLRELFGPPPGYNWIAIDYKSLQLIIFAYESGDEGLIRTFLEGGDPHNYVACQLFDTSAPTELERRIAKNVNYALIFGAGANKLDRTAGRAGIRDLYRSQFPSTDSYMQKVIKQGRFQGYVKTAWGYPITVSPDKAYKGVNYIIQGDEGEIVKRAMVNTHQFLFQEHPECRLIMQIHDELIFEFPEWYKFPLEDIKREMMEPAASIGWCTPVDAALITEHWGKKIEC